MMTEIEKIEYTKEFIDKLAKGINPLDDTPIPEGDLVNHVRLSRCFSYVSGILGKIIEKEKRKESNHKIPKRERFLYHGRTTAEFSVFRRAAFYWGILQKDGGTG